MAKMMTVIVVILKCLSSVWLPGAENILSGGVHTLGSVGLAASPHKGIARNRS
jgi:hypothetical protein